MTSDWLLVGSRRWNPASIYWIDLDFEIVTASEGRPAVRGVRLFPRPLPPADDNVHYKPRRVFDYADGTPEAEQIRAHFAAEEVLYK
jgi:hypothetical protein